MNAAAARHSCCVRQRRRRPRERRGPLPAGKSLSGKQFSRLSRLGTGNTRFVRYLSSGREGAEVNQTTNGLSPLAGQKKWRTAKIQHPERLRRAEKNARSVRCLRQCLPQQTDTCTELRRLDRKTKPKVQISSCRLSLSFGSFSSNDDEAFHLFVDSGPAPLYSSH